MAIYLGLGSNLANALGEPRQHMARAVARLSELGAVRTSSLYKSAPMGPTDQPDFYNAVAELIPHDAGSSKAHHKSKPLTPEKLLAFVQQLEQDAQRKRIRRWGERSLDVDILLFYHVVSYTDILVLPHYGILQRNFVAVPLLELAPDIVIGNKKLADAPVASDMRELKKIDTENWAF